MSPVVMDGGSRFLRVPVQWPNTRFGGVDLLAIQVANDFLRELGPRFGADRYGFRLMHHLAAQPWDELAGLYLWRGEPLLPPALVTVEEYEAVGDHAATADLLGHSDDPGLGVDRTVVEHPVLGRGTRYARRAKRRRQVFRSIVGHEVRWVWRIGGVRDVVVTFVRDDPQEFARILPDVEQLVADARPPGWSVPLEGKGPR